MPRDIDRRLGFTLIELLVVIGIISILAAIIFPVYAQAKLAAKGAVSLSNVRQQGIACLMYSADSDDDFVLATAWNTGSDPLCLDKSGGADMKACLSTWVWLIQPYMKSAEISVDPLGPPVQVASNFPVSVMSSLNPTYGYNYTALSPYYSDKPSDPSVHPVTHGVSQTDVTRPSNLPMILSKFATREWADPTDGLAFVTFFADDNADNGPAISVVVDPPDCVDSGRICVDNWGKGPIDKTQDLWEWLLKDNPMLGARSGGVSRRGSGMATVVYVDMHAKRLTAGALAAGTNWSDSLPREDLVITNPAQYNWTVDGN